MENKQAYQGVKVGDTLGDGDRQIPTTILEWVAMPSSKGSSQPVDRTQVSRIAGRFFTA